MLFIGKITVEDKELESEMMKNRQKIYTWVTKELEDMKVKNVKDKLNKIGKDSDKNGNISYTIDKTIKIKINRIEECPICLIPESEDVGMKWTKFKCCKKKIHIECKIGILKSNITSCTSCGSPLNNADNRLPFGNMTVNRSSEKVLFKGEYVPIIMLNYDMKGGADYSSESRNGIVPDTVEGNEVVDKLIHAFKRGFIFNIGVSVTRGVYGIVWGGIHHKTSYTGTWGYPDDTYLNRVSNELGSFNILGPYKGKLKSGNHKVYDKR